MRHPGKCGVCTHVTAKVGVDLDLDFSCMPAARELQKPSGHDLLRFTAKPRSIETKCHPVPDHVLPH